MNKLTRGRKTGEGIKGQVERKERKDRKEEWEVEEKENFSYINNFISMSQDFELNNKDPTQTSLSKRVNYWFL